MNIKDFLLARIAEDEAVAQAAIEDDGGSDEGFSGQYDRMVQPPSGVGFAQGGFGRPAARMIVTFAVPARILRECAAKRAIIGPVAKEVVSQWQVGDRTIESIISADQMERWSHGTGPNVDTLRALASVYSDHPDYQKEWAVQA